MFWENQTHYPFTRINNQSTGLKDPVRKILYRFKAKKRIYLVTIEEYSFGVHAIKFCGMKDRNHKDAYKKVYNDADGVRVISTCLHIMKQLWKRNPAISFAFYAVPKPAGMPNENARFDIYEYAMINLFSNTHFAHFKDRRHLLYVLLNKKHKRKKAVLRSIGRFLLSEFEMIFEPE